MLRYLIVGVILLFACTVKSQVNICLGDDEVLCIGTPYNLQNCTGNTPGNTQGIVLDNPTMVSLSDDSWSGAINMGFSFNFYGNTYNQCVIGSNCIISFDLSEANGYCSWSLSGAGTMPNPGFDDALNTFMPAYQDINPNVFTSPNGEIVYQTSYNNFILTAKRLFQVLYDGETYFRLNDGTIYVLESTLTQLTGPQLENLIPTKNKFHCYLNPERKVSDKAFEIHGYTDEFLSNKKKFHEVVDEFIEFIKNKRIVIHNAEFDLAHLNNELSLAGKKKIQNEIIDTLQIAREKYPGSSVSLDALCKKFRIDNSKRKKHTALIDCELLSKVYINLIDQKEPTLNFINNITCSNQ